MGIIFILFWTFFLQLISKIICYYFKTELTMLFSYNIRNATAEDCCFILITTEIFNL